MNFKKYIFNFKLKYVLKSDKILAKLREREKMNYDEIEALNFIKRKRIIQYAYDKIPFYKELYDKHNFNPKSLLTEGDWSQVPIVTRKDLKENTLKIINPSISSDRLIKSTTGGSTGQPLMVYFDKEVPLEVFGWRTMKWWGINPWENQAFVFRNVRKGFAQTLNSLKWFPTRRVLLDCSSMNSSDMDNFVKQINIIKPTYIQGYVGGIYDLAKYIINNNLKIHSVKAVWVTAAPLSESTRIFIEETFKAPVYDQYGCSEIFWIAAECKIKNGLHVLSDIRHLEFVNGQGHVVEDGNYGDAVITDLENKVFPIIRYKNGDSGRKLNRNCKCGLPFPLIDKIKGRVTDNIKTPSGIIVSGAYLTTIFDNYTDLVDAFQIIQNEDYSVVISCIIAKNQTKLNTNFIKIKKEFENKTNNEVEISFEFPKTLLQDRGKLKFVISKL